MIEAPLLVMRRVALIRKRFMEKGAVSPDTALTLEELNLHKRLAFHIMQLKHHIIEVNDRYYFDNENWDDSVAKKLNEFAVGFLEDIKQDDDEDQDKQK